MGERIADIDRAREAVARQAWHQAYEELRSIDPSVLAARDLSSIANKDVIRG